MKPRSSCQLCRKRHRRCIVKPGAAQCNGCDELGGTCEFSPKFRFRTERPRGAGRRRQSEPASRQSVRRSGEARSPDRTDLDEEQSKAKSPPSNAISHDSGSRESRPSTSDGLRGLNTRTVSSRRHSSADKRVRTDGDAAFSVLTLDNLLEQCTGPQAAYVDSNLTPPSDATYSFEQQHAADIRSWTSYSHENPPHAELASTVTSGQSPLSIYSITKRAPHHKLTRREASLFRLYTLRLAASSDACDDARHFELAVPRLAMEEPMILYGILALASRYDNLCKGNTNDLESTYYHNRCIELMIKALSRPPETYDSTLLTAVVISRLYEEYDPDTDTQYHHLSGTRNLLNHNIVMRFAQEGGLAEAASWVHLRQSIYVSLVGKKHLELPLGTFEAFTAFRKNDDTSSANQMVYIFAKVLQLFFPESSADMAVDPAMQLDQAPGDEEWRKLERELDAWYEAKPLSFEPIHHEPPDLDAADPFPSYWMMSTVPVVGMQHYYAAKIIFCLRQCSNTGGIAGFEAARNRRQNESVIASHLCSMMGLALCNDFAFNAFFLPSHMLFLCGYCIRNPLERQHTVKYLEQVKQVVQWKTEPVIQALKQQWAELDSYQL